MPNRYSSLLGSALPYGTNAGRDVVLWKTRSAPQLRHRADISIAGPPTADAAAIIQWCTQVVVRFMARSSRFGSADSLPAAASIEDGYRETASHPIRNPGGDRYPRNLARQGRYTQIPDKGRAISIALQSGGIVGPHGRS